MYYKIKPNDTLGKIAKKYAVSIELLLAYNKEIKNANHIFAGQVIIIPNLQDVPATKLELATTTANDLVARARTAIGKGIRYKLGAGGMKPELTVPTADKKCDCSGFVCWVIGLSRYTEIPFYAKFGKWISTDSMEADVNSSAGIFEKRTTPEVGCIVVYGAGSAIGHVGIVSEVKDGKMTKVIHCSSGNDKKFLDAIQETPPTVFNRPDAIWGRFTDIV